MTSSLLVRIVRYCLTPGVQVLRSLRVSSSRMELTASIPDQSQVLQFEVHHPVPSVYPETRIRYTTVPGRL